MGDHAGMRTEPGQLRRVFAPVWETDGPCAGQGRDADGRDGVCHERALQGQPGQPVQTLSGWDFRGLQGEWDPREACPGRSVLDKKGSGKEKEAPQGYGKIRFVRNISKRKRRMQ